MDDDGFVQSGNVDLGEETAKTPRRKEVEDVFELRINEKSRSS